MDALVKRADDFLHDYTAQGLSPPTVIYHQVHGYRTVWRREQVGHVVQDSGLSATIEAEEIIFDLKCQQPGARRQFFQVFDQPAVKNSAEASPFPLSTDGNVVEMNECRPNAHPN